MSRKNAKILIIEDDSFLARVYAAKFRKEGLHTLVLGDGVAAYEVALKEKPDVIVLDLIMPNKDGFAVLEELQSSAETKDIPVVVVSALSSASDIDAVLSLGAKKYLKKFQSSFSDISQEAQNHI